MGWVGRGVIHSNGGCRGEGSAAGVGREGVASLLARREGGQRGGQGLRQGQGVGQVSRQGVGLDSSQSAGQGIGRNMVETLESADETGGVQCGQRERVAQGTPQMRDSQLTLPYGTHLTAASQALRSDSAIQLSEQGTTLGSGTRTGYTTQAGSEIWTAGALVSDSSQHMRSRSQPARDEPETVSPTRTKPYLEC